MKTETQFTVCTSQIKGYTLFLGFPLERSSLEEKQHFVMNVSVKDKR